MSIFNNEKSGVGCMVLFGMPFAGVGVFMLVLLGWSIYDFVRMQTWRETPATILAVNMESSDEAEQVVAEYEYEFDGNKYSGSRVAINSMSDNIGDFQSRKFKELQSFHRQKKPFRCFVNPNAPNESIIYRQLRWELLAFFTLFCLVFGGAGFGIIGAALFAGGKLKDQAEREFQSPEEPWLWRPDWASGYVVSDNRTTMIALMVFGTFWNLIAWPVALIVMTQELGKGNYWVLLIGAFPLIGLGIASATLVAALRWRKYGQSRFQMAATPGVVGGALAGAVVAKNLESAAEFTQTLSCYRNRENRNKDNTREAIWQTSRVIDKKMPTGELDSAAVPVLFHIPFECLPTTMDDDSEIKWELEMKAATPGVDYRSVFEVPVFRTAASSADYKADDTLIEDYAKPDRPDSLYARSQIGRRTLGGRLHICFGYGRNIGATFALTIFLVVWTGGIFAMVTLGAPILFPIVFGLIDVFLLLALFDLVFWTSEFDIDATGLRGRVGVFRKSVDYGAGQIERVNMKKGMQAGNTVYYDLRLKLRGQKEITIGKGIKGHSDATYIAAEIAAALKLPDSQRPIDEDEVERDFE